MSHYTIDHAGSYCEKIKCNINAYVTISKRGTSLIKQIMQVQRTSIRYTIISIYRLYYLIYNAMNCNEH